MRRVAHHLLPGQGQQLVRPLVRLLEESGQRFGSPLQGALGLRTRALDVDAVRRHPHEHVGAEARAKLALPPLQSLRRRRGQVVGERGDLEDELVLQVVGFGHHPSEPGLREEVVRAVHAEEIVIRNVATSSTRSSVRRTSALASSGRAAPLP